MKKILCIALVVLMVLSLGACGKTNAPEAKPALVYATSADYPPFEFIIIDEAGNQQYAGIDVSLAKKIAEDMGRELKVVNMNFDSLMAAMQKGEADIVIAAIEDTPDRRVAADFSNAYYTDYPPMILVKKDNAANFTSLEDFSGLSVGAQTGTTKADIVTEQMPGANLVALTSVTDLVNELVYDKCAAIVLDGAVAMQYAASNEDLVVSEVSLGAAAPYCVAVEKGDPDGLLESINKTIAAVTSDGTIENWIAEADALAAQAVE